MAEEEQQFDRSEEATPHKIREARRRGQVTKSPELNSIALLMAGLVLFYFTGHRLISDTLDISRNLFTYAHNFTFDLTHVIALFISTVSAIVKAFLPFILTLVFIGIIINVAQTGPIFSLHPIKPDTQRLNPIKGLKRLFSIRLLFESAKNTLKIGIIGTTLYLFLYAHISKLIAFLDIPPQSYLSLILHIASLLTATLLATLAIIAIMDVAFTRWQYRKQLRMSHREVKDEIKRREGDPLIRSKVRELQREAARRAGTLNKVPLADVVITNPTHIAVALQYNRLTMITPEVIAMGAGELALKIRAVAQKHAIPVVENKKLARALFSKCDVSQPLPPEFFPQVAKILVWVMSIRKGLGCSSPNFSV
jgi:flagellar biosynthetic protein FlhB